MSDLIRMYGIKMSQKGVCRGCLQPRDKGSHDLCDRWPGIHSIERGFHFVGNSQETTLAELRRVVDVICKGDDDSTPVQFELRIRQPPRRPKRKRKPQP